jgi:hypothetical protein
MLERIIEHIQQNIRNEILQSGIDNVSLNYLLTRNLPEFIKHFFNQEVELWLREESEKFISNERFDYDSPEIQMLVDKILDTLKNTASFALNQFNRLLERAVKLEASYLIRPHQTLTQFLFKDNFVITTIEIHDMLKYFEKYNYYKDAFTEYFNLKYMREISQTQFEELIDGIDHQVFSKQPIETTLQTSKTILNFLNEGRDSNQETIPLDLLLAALTDRKLNDYSELISHEKTVGINELSLADLERILKTGKSLREQKEKPRQGVTTIKEIADIEEEKPEVEVDSISVSEEIIYPEETVVDEEEEAEEDLEQIEEEPKKNEESEVEEEKVVVEKPAQVVPPEEKADKEIVGVTAARERKTAEDELASLMSERMKGDQLNDIGKMISLRNKKRFVKKVFNKKEQQFQNFVDVINRTTTWREASYLIDDFFMREGVNPYSKDALEFTDLIYNRYHPKDIASQGSDF